MKSGRKHWSYRLTPMLLVGAVLLLLAAALACGERVVTETVIKEVPVEKVVTQEVIKEVPVEKVVTKEVVKEVPKEIVVEKEVVKTVEVPGETVVVEKEVIKEVEVEVIREVEVIKTIEVPAPDIQQFNESPDLAQKVQAGLLPPGRGAPAQRAVGNQRQ